MNAAQQRLMLLKAEIEELRNALLFRDNTESRKKYLDLANRVLKTRIKIEESL